MPNSSTPNLSAIRSRDEQIGRALAYHDDRLNNIGQQTNSTPVGITPPPAQLAALSVTGGAGIVHAVVSDSNPNYRGLSYHMEVVPAGGNFETHGHPIHTGPARAYRGALGSGRYDFRACSGFGTSAPSPWIYCKGVDATGTTAPEFPPTTGSGTGGGAWGMLPYSTTKPPIRS